jgi:hypothetical protein
MYDINARNLARGKRKQPTLEQLGQAAETTQETPRRCTLRMKPVTTTPTREVSDKRYYRVNRNKLYADAVRDLYKQVGTPVLYIEEHGTLTCVHECDSVELPITASCIAKLYKAVPQCFIHDADIPKLNKSRSLTPDTDGAGSTTSGSTSSTHGPASATKHSKCTAFFKPVRQSRTEQVIGMPWVHEPNNPLSPMITSWNLITLYLRSHERAQTYLGALSQCTYPTRPTYVYGGDRVLTSSSSGSNSDASRTESDASSGGSEIHEQHEDEESEMCEECHADYESGGTEFNSESEDGERGGTPEVNTKRSESVIYSVMRAAWRLMQRFISPRATAASEVCVAADAMIATESCVATNTTGVSESGGTSASTEPGGTVAETCVAADAMIATESCVATDTTGVSESGGISASADAEAVSGKDKQLKRDAKRRKKWEQKEKA